jgi:regulator of protease activity HflC (stomatin/prohibitin superfamily)
VPQQNAWVVERLGKYHATLTPGLNFLVPFVDVVAYKHSLKEIPLDVPSQICITRDNTQLQVDGILYFQVTDPTRASYGSSNYIVAVTQLAQTSLRSVIGKLELDKTFEERDIINAQVVQAIDEAALNWGVKVLRYEIKDLTPPKEILHAMQAQITAEREKRALIAGLRRPAPGADQHRHRRARGLHRPVGRRQAGGNQQGAGRGGGDRGRGRRDGRSHPQGRRVHSPAGGRAGRAVEGAERAVDAFGKVAQDSKTTLVIPANMGEVSGLIASAMKMITAVRPPEPPAAGPKPQVSSEWGRELR